MSTASRRSSSSSSSTHTTRSKRPTVWRPSPVSSSSSSHPPPSRQASLAPPPSLALVFAHAEQVSSTESAVTSLPTVMSARTLTPKSSMQSLASHTQSASLSSSPRSTRSSNQKLKSAAVRSTWFGSLSRAKGKGKAPIAEPVVDASQAASTASGGAEGGLEAVGTVVMAAQESMSSLLQPAVNVIPTSSSSSFAVSSSLEEAAVIANACTTELDLDPSASSSSHPPPIANPSNVVTSTSPQPSASASVSPTRSSNQKINAAAAGSTWFGPLPRAKGKSKAPMAEPSVEPSSPSNVIPFPTSSSSPEESGGNVATTGASSALEPPTPPPSSPPLPIAHPIPLLGSSSQPKTTASSLTPPPSSSPGVPSPLRVSSSSSSYPRPAASTHPSVSASASASTSTTTSTPQSPSVSASFPSIDDHVPPPIILSSSSSPSNSTPTTLPDSNNVDTPSNAHGQGTLTQRERKRTLSSLTPATSRFTLSYGLGYGIPIPWWGGVSTATESGLDKEGVSGSGGDGGGEDGTGRGKESEGLDVGVIERTGSTSSQDTRVSDTGTIRASAYAPPSASILAGMTTSAATNTSETTTTTTTTSTSTTTATSTVTVGGPMPSTSPSSSSSSTTSMSSAASTKSTDSAPNALETGIGESGGENSNSAGRGEGGEGGASATWWDYLTLTWRSTPQPQERDHEHEREHVEANVVESDDTPSTAPDVPTSLPATATSTSSVDLGTGTEICSSSSPVSEFASSPPTTATPPTSTATPDQSPPTVDVEAKPKPRRGWFYSSTTSTPPPSTALVPHDDAVSTATSKAHIGSEDTDTDKSLNAGTTSTSAVPETGTGGEDADGLARDIHLQPIASPTGEENSDITSAAVATKKEQEDGLVKEEAKDTDADVMSVKSNDTVIGSAWYSPWAWVGYGVAASAASVVGAEGGGEGEGGGGDVVTKALEAENIVAEASARMSKALTTTTSTSTSSTSATVNDTSTTVAATDTSTTHTSGMPDTTISTVTTTANPLEESISSHTSAWAYLFSTRGLLTKRIEGGSTSTPPSVSVRDSSGDGVGGGGDGNAGRGEMEVMNVDEEEGGEGGGSGSGNELVLSSKNKPVPSTPTRTFFGSTTPTKPSTASKSGEDDVRGRGRKEKGEKHGKEKDGKEKKEIGKDTKEKEKEKSSSKPPAPVLTISDSVKRDVASSTSNTTTTTTTTTSTTSTSTTPRKSRKSLSPAPSTKSTTSTKSKSKASKVKESLPNLVLPAWEDTFHTKPRNWVPRPPESVVARTMKFVSGVLFARAEDAGGGGDALGSGADGGAGSSPLRKRAGSVNGSGLSGRNTRLRGREGVGAKGKEVEKEVLEFGRVLPRAWDVMDSVHTDANGSGSGGCGSKNRNTKAGASTGGVGGVTSDVLRGCKKVVVIGIHGWFPGAVMRSVLGEPTGTSSKFVNMMVQALEDFQAQEGVQFDKITKIPLEGEGTIDKRVDKLFTNLIANEEWVQDVHAADAIFVATHSQGSIVSTHLLDRLLNNGHIVTSQSASVATSLGGLVDGISPTGGAQQIIRKPQKVCCLALCGIHLGPLRYLSTSSLLQPYIQYFESTAAKELFDFQNTESPVSKAYVQALHNVLDHRVKMVYVASLNDQVVPIYSGLFTSASHPLILRALYIDGDAYHSSDFLSNLLVLLLRIMNSGLSDSGLLTHLSEATAGSLNGVGHSTAYEELSVFSLAVKYLFLTNDGLEDPPELAIEPFNVNNELNDYEIPWALRDLIADDRVYHLFEKEITQLRDAFRDWQPRTTVLRDIKRKLQPIQRLPSSSSTPTAPGSISKL